MIELFVNLRIFTNTYCLGAIFFLSLFIYNKIIIWLINPIYKSISRLHDTDITVKALEPLVEKIYLKLKEKHPTPKKRARLLPCSISMLANNVTMYFRFKTIMLMWLYLWILKKNYRLIFSRYIEYYQWGCHIFFGSKIYISTQLKKKLRTSNAGSSTKYHHLALSKVYKK